MVEGLLQLLTHGFIEKCRYRCGTEDQCVLLSTGDEMEIKIFQFYTSLANVTPSNTWQIFIFNSSWIENSS
ncbi:hypothetical protein OV760_30080, partial [Salmonella enterica subsp. enterica serovar 1,4,[5],12:i:-]|nr:hypothetical protein [Salmonella enterica subsp. enterica serovar 1,4,[5],12:i:-]